MIFQVTKELPNLPAGRVARLGISPEDAAEVVQTARRIRDAGRLSPRIVIEVLDGVAVDVSIAEERPSHALKVVVDRHVIANWRALLLDVISWLDERELFLRTGYGSKEISPVANRFSRLTECG
jgi:hypothetical protein